MAGKLMDGVMGEEDGSWNGSLQEKWNDVDLYSDFICNEVEEEGDEKERELREVQQKYADQVKICEELKESNAKLEERNKTLLENICRLFKTARQEICKKNKELKRMQQRLDAIIFRRTAKLGNLNEIPNGQFKRQELDNATSAAGINNKNDNLHVNINVNNSRNSNSQVNNNRNNNGQFAYKRAREASGFTRILESVKKIKLVDSPLNDISGDLMKYYSSKPKPKSCEVTSKKESAVSNSNVILPRSEIAEQHDFQNDSNSHVIVEKVSGKSREDVAMDSPIRKKGFELERNAASRQPPNEEMSMSSSSTKTGENVMYHRSIKIKANGSSHTDKVNSNNNTTEVTGKLISNNRTTQVTGKLDSHDKINVKNGVLNNSSSVRKENCVVKSVNAEKSGKSNYKSSSHENRLRESSNDSVSSKYQQHKSGDKNKLVKNGVLKDSSSIRKDNCVVKSANADKRGKSNYKSSSHENRSRESSNDSVSSKHQLYRTVDKSRLENRNYRKESSERTGTGSNGKIFRSPRESNKKIDKPQNGHVASQMKLPSKKEIVAEEGEILSDDEVDKRELRKKRSEDRNCSKEKSRQGGLSNENSEYLKQLEENRKKMKLRREEILLVKAQENLRSSVSVPSKHKSSYK